MKKILILMLLFVCTTALLKAQTLGDPDRYSSISSKYIPDPPILTLDSNGIIHYSLTVNYPEEWESLVSNEVNGAHFQVFIKPNILSYAITAISIDTETSNVLLVPSGPVVYSGTYDISSYLSDGGLVELSYQSSFYFGGSNIVPSWGFDSYEFYY